jgi:hypothetical protein
MSTFRLLLLKSQDLRHFDGIFEVISFIFFPRFRILILKIAFTVVAYEKRYPPLRGGNRIFLLQDVLLKLNKNFWILSSDFQGLVGSFKMLFRYSRGPVIYSPEIAAFSEHIFEY